MNNGISTNYSINAMINRSLNGFASTVTYVLDKSGGVVAPCVLGYTGGWLTGVGKEIGLFQGAVSGTYYSFIHKPVAKYINHNKGQGEDQIHTDTASMLELVGIVASVALPIVLTKYCGQSAVEKVSSLLPKNEYLKWILTSTPTRQYSWIMGGLVNIAPAIAQYWISAWRDEDKSNKENDKGNKKHKY